MITKIIFKTKIKYLLLLFFAMIFLIAGCSKNKDADVLDIDLREHKNLVMHIHPTLEIEILGEKQLIPSYMGRSDKGMSVIHAHDSSGNLHIESPFSHQFYLKDVFTIWEKNFNSTCIFDYCTDKNHTLEVFVNGIKDGRFGDIPLNDHDSIKVVYKT